MENDQRNFDDLALSEDGYPVENNDGKALLNNKVVKRFAENRLGVAAGLAIFIILGLYFFSDIWMQSATHLWYVVALFFLSLVMMELLPSSKPDTAIEKLAEQMEEQFSKTGIYARAAVLIGIGWLAEEIGWTALPGEGGIQDIALGTGLASVGWLLLAHPFGSLVKDTSNDNKQSEIVAAVSREKKGTSCLLGLFLIGGAVWYYGLSIDLYGKIFIGLALAYSIVQMSANGSLYEANKAEFERYRASSNFKWLTLILVVGTFSGMQWRDLLFVQVETLRSGGVTALREQVEEVIQSKDIQTHQDNSLELAQKLSQSAASNLEARNLAVQAYADVVVTAAASNDIDAMLLAIDEQIKARNGGQ